MPLDFRADQIQVGKLIPSASNGTNAKLLIYSASADTAPYNQGNINSARFNTSAIGTDTFVYISGTRASSVATLPASTAKTVFGGDTHHSGAITIQGFGGNNQDVLHIGNRVISTPDNVFDADISVFAGGKSDGSTGGAINIIAGSGLAGDSFGGQIFVRSGDGDGSGNAGDAYFIAGAGGSGQGPGISKGGNVFIGGGNALSSNAYGLVSIGDKSYVAGSSTKLITFGVSDATTYNSGSDKFFIVSGTVGGRRIGTRNVAVFEGDVVISGTLFVSSSISGSHHKLYDGLDFLVGGTNVTLITGTNGQVTISATTSSSGADPNASYLVVGLTSSLSNERQLAAGPGIVFNDLGAGGVFAISASLVAGPNIVINTLGNGSLAITGSGGSGSNQWIEGTPSPRLRTTASVSISSLSEFAETKGSNVWFYVSGTISPGYNELVATGGKRAVFGGDVHHSGSIIVEGQTSGGNKLFITAGTIFTPNDVTTNDMLIAIGQKTVGTGGNMNIAAGNGSVVGGQVVISAGQATGTGASNGGGFFIYSGNGSDNGTGGTVQIGAGAGGDTTTVTSAGPGGAVQITAGNGGTTTNIATSAGQGGDVTISAGNSAVYQSNPTASRGGQVNINAGEGASAATGDNPAGDGGDIVIVAGPAGTPFGAGDVGRGGDVIVIAGQNSDPDRNGSISLGDKSVGATKIVAAGINISTHVTGSDKFFIVSGVVDGRNLGGRNVAVFEGDVVISGNLFVSSSISGSHHKLYNGLDYLVAGTGVTLLTQSNGQVVISSTVTGSSSGSSGVVGSGSIISLGLVDWKSSNATDSSAEVVGQYFLDSTLYTGSILFRALLATTNASYSASVQLANLTLGGLVEIGGPGVTKLTTNGTTPSVVQSGDLKSAGNFTLGGATYEVRVFTQNSIAQVNIGGGEFRVTASVANSTPVTQFVSGSGFPDTPLPRLEWVGDGLVTVIANNYSNVALDYWRKPIRVTFQDGIQRIYTSSNSLDVMFITSTIVGTYGIDSGSSIESRGGNQWYYVYLIPSGTNNGQTKLSVIASTTSPSGVFGTSTYGPNGYTNFRYIGPIYYKTTGKGTPGLEVFKQNDSKTFYYNNAYSIYAISSTMDANTTSPTIPFSLMTSSVFPPSTTAAKLYADLSLNLSGANVVDSIEHQIFVNGALSAFTSPSSRTRINGPYCKTINNVILPVGYLREYHSWEMKYRTTQDSTAWPAASSFTASLSWNGFEDQYLSDFIPQTSLTGTI